MELRSIPSPSAYLKVLVHLWAPFYSEEEFIHHSRRIRKRIGGGWRQAGLLAGAAIYALENNVTRLAKDHGAAKDMAKFLSEQTWVKNVVAPETNILIFGLNEDVDQEAFIST